MDYKINYGKININFKITNNKMCYFKVKVIIFKESNMLKVNLIVINNEISWLEKEIKTSCINNKKVELQMHKINSDIIYTRHKIKHKLFHYNKLNKNMESLRKNKADLYSLQQRFNALRSKVPKIVYTPDNRNFVKRIINSISKIMYKPFIRMYNYGLFLGARKKINDKKTLLKLIKIEKKINKLRIKNLPTSSLEKKAVPLREKADRIEAFRKKGEAMRTACLNIGGEWVTLNTADDVRLDGMFLNARSFRKTLAAAGCQQTVMRPVQNSESNAIRAIYLSEADYEKSGKEVIQALDELGAFGEISNLPTIKSGAGWQVVFGQTGRFLIQTSDLPSRSDVNPHDFLFFNNENNRWETRRESLAPSQFEPIDTKSPATGTLLLTSGSLGIYEQNKKEMVFYLLHNMNVMAFNFRGYALSEGSPSVNGLKLDMEAAYQFAKKRAHHTDEQMVIKAMCMSSAVAAYVASKHPRMHIILDQTYSTLREMIKGGIKERIDEKWETFSWLKNRTWTKKIVSNLASLAASLFVPNMNTARYLTKNNGQKALFYTHEDKYISTDLTVQNIQALTKAKKLHTLTVISGPGEHAAAITGIRAVPADFSKKEIISVTNKLAKLAEEQKVVEKNIHKYKTKIEKLNVKMTSNSQHHSIKIKKDHVEHNLQNEQAKLDTVLQERHKLEIVWDDLVGNKKTTPTGQNQLKHFLRKAKVLGNIIAA